MDIVAFLLVGSLTLLLWNLPTLFVINLMTFLMGHILANLVMDIVAFLLVGSLTLLLVLDGTLLLCHWMTLVLVPGAAFLLVAGGTFIFVDGLLTCPWNLLAVFLRDLLTMSLGRGMGWSRIGWRRRSLDRRG